MWRSIMKSSKIVIRIFRMFFVILSSHVFWITRAYSVTPIPGYKVYDVPSQGKFYLDDKKDFIKDGLKQGLVWEPKIQSLLKEHIKPGSVVVDAGAHIGIHTITMARLVGQKGTVIAFEPQEKIFRELVMNIALNGFKNVQAKNNALGDKRKWVRMFNAETGNEAGIPICAPGVTTCGNRVPMIALDSLALSNVSLLKIDVEGAEDMVLDGARKTIAQNRPVIIIEICGGNPIEQASEDIKRKILATKNKLEKMNYNVSRIDLVDYLALPKSLPAASIPPKVLENKEQVALKKPKNVKAKKPQKNSKQAKAAKQKRKSVKK